ncbi:MAG: hypothetical protein ABJM06_12550 [Gilvibacter sp.]
MKYLKISGGIMCVLLLVLAVKSCIINNPKPEECVVHKAKIIAISEGTSFDVIFKDAGGDKYYINRGLEQGLTLQELKNKVLNKEATMHLPKFAIGTSEHIAQLTVNGTVLYTEFK